MANNDGAIEYNGVISISVKTIINENTAYGPQATKNANTIVKIILATWVSAFLTTLVFCVSCFILLTCKTYENFTRLRKYFSTWFLYDISPNHYNKVHHRTKLKLFLIAWVLIFVKYTRRRDLNTFKIQSSRFCSTFKKKLRHIVLGRWN